MYGTLNSATIPFSYRDSIRFYCSCSYVLASSLELISSINSTSSSSSSVVFQHIYNNSTTPSSVMVDLQTVCCMCGDVGFPDKLFRCNKCQNRFQHSYCSNYYSELAEPIELCDWCQSEERNSRHRSSSKKSSAGNGTEIIVKRSEYSGDKIKQQNREESSGEHKGKSSGTPSPSPRTTTRRYKLLKDVMC